MRSASELGFPTADFRLLVVLVVGTMSESDETNASSGRSVEESIVIARQQANDRAELLEQYRDYLLLVANQELDSKVQAKVAASDLVQETLVRAHDRFELFSGDGGAELQGWLRKILLNQLADARKRFRRQKRNVAREIALDGERSGQAKVEPAADSLSPSGKVAQAEESHLVMLALDKLSGDQKNAIIWRNFERLSFAEIGNRLSRSEDAARKLWCRAIDRIQKELGDLNDSHSR